MNIMVKNRVREAHVNVSMVVGMSLLSLLFPMLSHAGVDVIDEGDVAYNTSIGYTTSTQNWDQNRKRVSSPCHSKNWANRHSLSYGYSYYTTLFTSATLHKRQCGASHASGVGDVTLGFRHRFNNYKDNLAWEASIIVPTGYDTNNPSRLGNGAVGFDLGVIYSSEDGSFGILEPSFWKLRANVRTWTGSPANEARGSITWNYRVGKSDRFKTGMFGSFSFGKAQQVFVNQQNLSGADKFTYRAAYSHQVSRGLNLSINAGKAVWGRNASNDTNLRLSLDYRWR